MTPDMTGERFNRITVLGISDRFLGSSRLYRCLCQCGAEIYETRAHLQSGKRKSCGCLTKDRVIHRVIRKMQCIERLPNDDVILLCTCGNTFRRTRKDFIDLKVRDCGCNRPTGKDLTGMKFSRLTVISFHGPSSQGNRWRCLCDCGNETVVNGSQMKRKNVQSCGCLLRETSSAWMKSLRQSGQQKKE